MNKKLIRLTESDLHRIVKESVNRVLNEVLDTADSVMKFRHDKGNKLNKPMARLKSKLNPKWADKKRDQMSKLYDREDDIRRIDRHLGNMDDGYYHHGHIIDDSNIESWLDQESDEYPGFTNRQLRDLEDAGFGGKYKQMYLSSL